MVALNYENVRRSAASRAGTPPSMWMLACKRWVERLLPFRGIDGEDPNGFEPLSDEEHRALTRFAILYYTVIAILVGYCLLFTPSS